MNKGCIEGHSGTGKTSMTTHLEKDGVIKRFGEYFHYLEKGELFPVIDADSGEKLAQIRKQLFTLLTRREDDISTSKTELPIVYERSPVTFLYTEAIRIQQGYMGNLELLARELLNLLQTTSEPDYYIFLHVDPVVAKARLAKERLAIDTNFFYQEQTNHAIKSFLEFFSNNYLSPDQQVTIVNESVSTTLASMKDAIQELSLANIEKQKATQNLCYDIIHGLDLVKVI